MSSYILRDLPADLWARVKQRAATETPPGQHYRLESKIHQLLDCYARLGLAEVLRRCGSDPALGLAGKLSVMAQIPLDPPLNVYYDPDEAAGIDVADAAALFTVILNALRHHTTVMVAQSHPDSSSGDSRP